MNSVVSIIVPTYNAGVDNLARCIASVLAQSHDNIEVLICDDGSKEECAAAMDEIASWDSRCRVLHLPHAGVSATRNAGIEASRGDWLAFVDDDDEVAPYFVREALEIALRGNADFIAGDVERPWVGDMPHDWGHESADRSYVLLEDKKQLDAYRAQYLSFLDSNLKGVPRVLSRGPVVKLYKRSLIDDARFNPLIAQGEDALFNFQYLGKCSRIIQAQSIWYRYWQYLSSSTHAVNLELRKQGLTAVHTTSVDSRFINARRAFEYHLATEGAEMVMKHCEGGFSQRVGETSSALQELSQGGCFAGLDLREFAISAYRASLYRLCHQKRYRVAAVAMVLKEKVKGGHLA